MLRTRSFDIVNTTSDFVNNKFPKLKDSIGADLSHLEQDRAIRTEPGETRRRRTIRLIRNNGQSWGFTLQTYGIRHKRTQEVEIMSYVDYVEINGSAWIAGMQRGDIILSVNGESVESCTHKELVTKIQTCGREMRLVTLFGDCCQKVELHERYIRLKRLLSQKVKELHRLEAEERMMSQGLPLSRLDVVRQSTYSSSSSDWDMYSEIISPSVLDSMPVNRFAFRENCNQSISDISIISSTNSTGSLITDSNYLIPNIQQELNSSFFLPNSEEDLNSNLFISENQEELGSNFCIHKSKEELYMNCPRSMFLGTDDITNLKSKSEDEDNNVYRSSLEMKDDHNVYRSSLEMKDDHNVYRSSLEMKDDHNVYRSSLEMKDDHNLQSETIIEESVNKNSSEIEERVEDASSRMCLFVTNNKDDVMYETVEKQIFVGSDENIYSQVLYYENTYTKSNHDPFLDHISTCPTDSHNNSDTVDLSRNMLFSTEVENSPALATDTDKRKINPSQGTEILSSARGTMEVIHSSDGGDSQSPDVLTVEQVIEHSEESQKQASLTTCTFCVTTDSEVCSSDLALKKISSDGDVTGTYNSHDALSCNTCIHDSASSYCIHDCQDCLLQFRLDCAQGLHECHKSQEAECDSCIVLTNLIVPSQVHTHCQNRSSTTLTTSAVPQLTEASDVNNKIRLINGVLVNDNNYSTRL